MKNRLGWSLATLAIFTFSFGQVSASASQVLTARGASVAAQSPPAAAAIKAPAKPAATVKSSTKAVATAKSAAITAKTPAVATAVKPAPPKAAAAFAPTDPTVVPHYFGPTYSNWAWTPQVKTSATVTVDAPTGTAPAVTVGNPLTIRQYATDTDPATLVVLQNAKLPAGTLESFLTWNRPGDEGLIFHAYLLRPTGVTNGYTVVYDSGALTVPTPSGPTGAVETFPVSTPVAVQANDVIGFYGQGIPLDVGTVSDTYVYPVPSAPVLASTFTMGVDPGFPIFPQNRQYSFAASVAPGAVNATATATVDPNTGAVTGYTVTEPGSGYLTTPGVTVTGPAGATGAAGVAVLGSGMISSFTVLESGFGFHTTSVAITGGGGSLATAEASGGADDLTLVSGGTGYATQPIVEFTGPDAAYCTPAPVPACQRPTATATMDALGHVNSVTLRSEERRVGKECAL